MKRHKAYFTIAFTAFVLGIIMAVALLPLWNKLRVNYLYPQRYSYQPHILNLEDLEGYTITGKHQRVPMTTLASPWDDGHGPYLKTEKLRIGTASWPPSEGHKIHKHRKSEQFYLVLGGEADMTVADQTFKISKNDFILVPLTPSIIL